MDRQTNSLWSLREIASSVCMEVNCGVSPSIDLFSRSHRCQWWGALVPGKLKIGIFQMQKDMLTKIKSCISLFPNYKKYAMLAIQQSV